MTVIIFIILLLPWIMPTILFPLFNIMDIMELMIAIINATILISLIKKDYLSFNLTVYFIINLILLFSNRLDLLYIKNNYLTVINTFILFISSSFIYFKLKKIDCKSSKLFFFYLLYIVSFLIYLIH